MGGNRQAIVAMVLAFSCVGGVVRSDPRPTNAERRERLEQTDRNGDASVDRSEFHARIVDVFFFSDGDRDGFLVVSEYAATGADPQRFSSADVDDSGRISLYEFIEDRFEVFEVIDVDESGTLSETELLGVSR